MCFTVGALRRVPHSAFSIVEDLEYGIRLGEAGIRVHFAPEARVLGEMVSDAARSQSQRRRWEGGRVTMIRVHGLALLQNALRKRDPVLFDLALDVLVPPLSWIATYTGLGASAAGMLLLGHVTHEALLGLWLLPCAFLLAYVLRGVYSSRMGVRGLVALAWAPAFMTWKLLLLVTHPRETQPEWIRTARPPGHGTA
jgi:1,2-diacylglycerol 3-beta-glucosyltransferase